MTEFLVKFQKNIFALTLVSAIFLGSSLAYLGSVGLQFFLHSRPVEATTQVSEAPRPRQDRPTFKPVEEFEGVITGAFVRDSGATMAAGSPGNEGEGAAGQITLLGVIAGSDQFARAAVQEEGKPEVREYRVGQTVAGFKIVGIGSSSIMVERGSNQLKIVIGQKSGEAKTQTAGDAKGPAAAGGTKVTLSRDKLNAALNNQTELYKAKFAPITIDKKIVGMRLLMVPNDHFLYEMGARTGDIIRRFNGQPLDNTDKLMQIFGSLKTMSRVTVEVERSGKILPFEIIIQ